MATATRRRCHRCHHSGDDVEPAAVGPLAECRDEEQCKRRRSDAYRLGYLRSATQHVVESVREGRGEFSDLDHVADYLAQHLREIGVMVGGGTRDG